MIFFSVMTRSMRRNKQKPIPNDCQEYFEKRKRKTREEDVKHIHQDRVKYFQINWYVYFP